MTRVMAPAAGSSLGLAVDGLAVFRLTRLATTDTITARARARLAAAADESGWPPGRWLVDMLDCPWCAGMWAAAAAAAASRLAPGVWRPAARILAVAAVAGLLAER